MPVKNYKIIEYKRLDNCYIILNGPDVNVEQAIMNKSIIAPMRTLVAMLEQPSFTLKEDVKHYLHADITSA